EGESQAAADHSEVVLRSIDDIPTEVIHPADMRSDSEFQPAAKLAYRFAGRAMVDSMIERDRDFSGTSEAIENNFISFAPSKDKAATGPDVGSKTGTGNGIAQGKTSQHIADRTVLAPLFLDKYFYTIGLDVKT